jgi:S-DNA-T family DNA segregation ATPase FtsK/SpoIIIE
MHIGYPRASRLIDDMHEMGIVGPKESGGRPRRVLELAGERPEVTGDENGSNGSGST